MPAIVLGRHLFWRRAFVLSLALRALAVPSCMTAQLRLQGIVCVPFFLQCSPCNNTIERIPLRLGAKGNAQLNLHHSTCCPGADCVLIVAYSLQPTTRLNAHVRCICLCLCIFLQRLLAHKYMCQDTGFQYAHVWLQERSCADINFEQLRAWCDGQPVPSGCFHLEAAQTPLGRNFAAGLTRKS